jgi:hypothetical protein
MFNVLNLTTSHLSGSRSGNTLQNSTKQVAIGQLQELPHIHDIQ